VTEKKIKFDKKRTLENGIGKFFQKLTFDVGYLLPFSKFLRNLKKWGG
jgi:hypothetical protein